MLLGNMLKELWKMDFLKTVLSRNNFYLLQHMQYAYGWNFKEENPIVEKLKMCTVVAVFAPLGKPYYNSDWGLE